MKPVVSICIANYNGMGLIDSCIESVRAQDCDFPFEIIVHDDASTDESADHIRQNHPNVVLIESKDNVGFCIANNRMANAAKGDFLLLLNNDAELYTDALRVLYEDARHLERHAILSLPQFDFHSGDLIDRGCLLDPFFNPVPNIDPLRKNLAMVIGACLWLPKPLWEKLGGFPEWFESIGEDLYLCCKARLYGYDVLVARESGYRHRVGNSFGGGKPINGLLTTTYQRRLLSERNKCFVIILMSPVPVFLLLLPLHLLLLGLEATVLVAAKWDIGLWTRVYRPCFSALWRERSKLRALRAILQEECKHLCTPKQFFSVFDWRPYKLRMLLKYGLPIVK